MHTPLDLCDSIPSFGSVSDGLPRDVNVLNTLPVEAGADYAMDRACLDFQRPCDLNLAGPSSPHGPSPIFGVVCRLGSGAERQATPPLDICNRLGYRRRSVRL